MLDVDDRRPVEDVLCGDESYAEAYRRAGLAVVLSHRPLGNSADPYVWVTETSVSPWVIYVLRRVCEERY